MGARRIEQGGRISSDGKQALKVHFRVLVLAELEDAQCIHPSQRYKQLSSGGGEGQGVRLRAAQRRVWNADVNAAYLPQALEVDDGDEVGIRARHQHLVSPRQHHHIVRMAAHPDRSQRLQFGAVQDLDRRLAPVGDRQPRPGKCLDLVREFAHIRSFQKLAGLEIKPHQPMVLHAGHDCGGFALDPDSCRHLTARNLDLARPSEPAVFKRDRDHRVFSVRSQQQLLLGLVVKSEPQAGQHESIGNLLAGLIVGEQVVRRVTRVGADQEPIGRFDQIERHVARRYVIRGRAQLRCGHPQAEQRRENQRDCCPQGRAGQDLL